jgi:hypothetical protein
MPPKKDQWLNLSGMAGSLPAGVFGSLMRSFTNSTYASRTTCILR